MQEHLLPAIEKIVEGLPEVTHVIVQMDQAGGHGGGRSDMSKILSSLNSVGSTQRIPVQFITQPSRYALSYCELFHLFISRSPDFNALDLGAWRSLAAGVPSLKGKDKSGRLIDRIIFHVLDRWKSWDAAHRLMNIFNTKSRIMQTVSSVNGSNEYKLPRSEFSHAAERATYIPHKLSNESERPSMKETDEDESEDEKDEVNQQCDDECVIEIDIEDDVPVVEESGFILRNEVFGERVSEENEILQWWNARKISYEIKQ